MIQFLRRFAKKIELLNEHIVGLVENDLCHRNFCLGTIQKIDGSCVCHMGNPPCSYCTNGLHYCDTCDWEE